MVVEPTPPRVTTVPGEEALVPATAIGRRVPGLVATPLLSERGVELGRRGRKWQLAVEGEYWKLILGLGVREIARRLGRSPSTVSRELRRNLRPHHSGVYEGVISPMPELGERVHWNRAGRFAID
jgi:hypothetical protein